MRDSGLMSASADPPKPVQYLQLWRVREAKQTRKGLKKTIQYRGATQGLPRAIERSERDRGPWQALQCIAAVTHSIVPTVPLAPHCCRRLFALR
jgi:hypothetical protein